FDQFVKQKLKVKFYARYTDDFVIVSRNKNYLEELIGPIKDFLKNNLALKLHPKKISIRKMDWGIDFLGYVTLPRYRLLRVKTKQRIFKKLKEQTKQFKQNAVSEQTLNQSLQSYLGVLTHANTYRLSEDLKNQFWFWLTE
ncbi:MAG: RNA-dependent DNA polymerase, partial [Patescibacteria group bacterium]